MNAAQLAATLSMAGSVSIPWVDAACDAARPLTLHCHRGCRYTPDRPVVLVQHGMGRNGDEYRDFWVKAAERHGLLIVATTFGARAWPAPEHYNNGLVLDEAGTPRPRESWAYAIPLRVFAALREARVTRCEKALLFGHSAGGQFGHRLLSTQPHDLLEAAMIGNPGWYSLPDLATPFPAGLGGIGLGDGDVERLLRFPMTILAGDRDTETSGPSLPAQPAAIAQGPHRFARAQHYFEAGRAEAARRGVAFNWRLVVVPGIGHDGAAMSRVAAGLWFEKRLLTAAEAGAAGAVAL